MNNILHILLVDDDHRMTHTLADILALAGHKTTQAASGKQALELARTTKFDCVLTDIKMPDMNGVELNDALRQEQPDLPIVLMTAYTSDELVNRGLQMGVAGVLEKPLDLQLLLQFFSSLKRTQSIAIIDNDPAFCRTLGDILQRRGYSVTAITDPHQAASLIKDQHQIILLDMKLNAMNGYELLKEIRSIFPELPVVVITGYREEMAVPIQSAIEIKAHTCLYKPLEIEKLFQVLHEIELLQMRKLLSNKRGGPTEQRGVNE
jgi:CheY-like chemotaxis protein